MTVSPFVHKAARWLWIPASVMLVGSAMLPEPAQHRLSAAFGEQQQANRTAKLVAIATKKNDHPGLDNSEPSIAVNPKNPNQIAVLVFAEGWDYAEANPTREDMAPIWKSNDGGATWSKVRQIPCPRLGYGGPADQHITFDAQGHLVVSQMTKGGKPSRCYIYRQTGNDPDAKLTPGPTFGYDQPLLDVDLSPQGPCPNTLYCSFLDYVSKDRYGAAVVISADNGKSGTQATPSDRTHSNGTSRIAAGPKGKVYLLYKSQEGKQKAGFEQAHFWVVRSDDCGKTWGKPVSVHGPNPVETFYSTETHPFGNPAKGMGKNKSGRARSSDAWIAVHPENGTVFVTYVSKDKSGFGQIYVAESKDLGATWQEPSRVTDGQNHSAYPTLAVAKTGALGVLYVDYDDSKEYTSFRHRLARSFDAGKTWTDQVLQEFDPNPLENAHDGFLWGDYQGLTANGDTFYGVFSGKSLPNQRDRDQLDPIFFTEKAK